MKTWAEEQIDRLNEVWSNDWLFIQALTDEQLDTELPEGRTVKQVLAHIAFWEEAGVGYVRSILRREHIHPHEWYGGTDLGLGKNDPWPSADVHNAREAQWAAHQPRIAILMRLQNARTRFLELLQTVTPAEADGEVGDYFKSDDLIEHFQAHLREIRAALENQDKL